MNKKEAIRAMLDGEKVIQEDYLSEKYFHMVDGCFVTALDNPYDMNELPDGGWGIYCPEPVYEWQWCVVMDDNTASVYGYHTERAIDFMFPERQKFKLSSTKRKSERF